jgi:hypothetical protein
MPIIAGQAGHRKILLMLFGAAVIALGLWMAVTGWLNRLHTLELRRNGIAVEAVVREIYYSENNSDFGPELRVKFDYRAGTDGVFTADLYGLEGEDAYASEKKVRVIYDPAHPWRVEFEHTPENYNHLILSGIALFFIALGGIPIAFARGFGYTYTVLFGEVSFIVVGVCISSLGFFMNQLSVVDRIAIVLFGLGMILFVPFMHPWFRMLRDKSKKSDFSGQNQSRPDEPGNAFFTDPKGWSPYGWGDVRFGMGNGDIQELMFRHIRATTGSLQPRADVPVEIDGHAVTLTFSYSGGGLESFQLERPSSEADPEAWRRAVLKELHRRYSGSTEGDGSAAFWQSNGVRLKVTPDVAILSLIRQNGG